MATAKDRAPTKSKLQTNALGFQPWANMLAVDIVRTAGQVSLRILLQAYV